MTGRRYKVLIIAHELSPFSGSECAVGWNLVMRIAQYHDVTVLHASGSQTCPFSYIQALQQYFTDNPDIEGLKVISVNQPLFTRSTALVNSLFRRIGPIGLPALYYIGYKAWQRKAFKVAVKLHNQFTFNVVHQITQIAYRAPGLAWKMGIPFFWGPTGGVANLPWEFYRHLSAGSKVVEGIRFVSNEYQARFSLRIKNAISSSEVIYTYSNEDASFFNNNGARQVAFMLDVGTTPSSVISSKNSEDQAYLDAVWCGQLTYRKAPDIIIKALAEGEITREKVRLTIIGEGPMEKNLHRLADQLNLANIRWIKKIPHEEVFAIMKTADFLVHTSLREATSSVIPEALSVGLPVICHDINGMGVAITETCGIKVPLISYEKSIRGFYEAMVSLVRNREILDSLKKGATDRSLELSWDNMAKRIAYDYRQVLEGKNLKNSSA